MDKKRLKRKNRIRMKVSGTLSRPRLTVTKSLNQIYAQIIDDQNGNTLVSACSLSKEIAAECKDSKGKLDKSVLVGKLLAKKALEKDIKQVVFDRNGYPYHGRVKALADSVRESGVNI